MSRRKAVTTSTLIALDRDPDYAPCCYLICRVLNPEAGEGHYDWDTRDEANTVPVQTDWDYPGIASTFGWTPEPDPGGCTHDGTDGTVDCTTCGRTASEMIAEAQEFLDDHLGTVVEDPGYFDAR
jgi:hypothetical protein